MNNDKQKKNKNYTFSIDQTDPKYSKLIDFLDNMEKGVRSFVIRQILNAINSQTGDGVFNLLGGSLNLSDNNTEELKDEKQQTRNKQ